MDFSEKTPFSHLQKEEPQTLEPSSGKKSAYTTAVETVLSPSFFSGSEASMVYT